MYKKLICFILILSFFVPFLPSFDFVVRAYDLPSASVDQAMNDLGFYYDESDGLYKSKMTAPIGKQIGFMLADYGYVVRDDPFGVIVDYIANIVGVPYSGNGYTTSQAQTISDFGVVSSNVVNYSIEYAENNLTYIMRSTVHVSDFLTLLSPIAPGSNATRANNCFNALKPIVNGSSSNVYIYTEPWNNRFFILPVLYGIDRDDFVNFSFYVIDNSTLNDKYKVNGNGIIDFGSTSSANPGFPSPSLLWVVSGNSIISDLSLLRSSYSTSTGFSSPSYVSVNYNTSPFSVGLGKWLYSNNANNGGGSFFIIADSLDNFQFPVFLDVASVQSFFDGSAPVYKFDSDLQLSPDIDYSRLYDIISNEVRHSSGNIQNAINNVANNYLQQQLDLLHDINNALNAPSGESWLHKIYDLLDYNFPLTLSAFKDLKDVIENISVTGGSADLTYTNRVLDQINDKLGFLIDQPILDGTPQDFEELRTLAQNKFPFCVFSDIVALTVILNQSPEEPHWQVPLKLPGSVSANNVVVDLSWYEYIRDYVHAIFIFMFIIGLLVLSVKIFDAVKS